MLWAGLLLQVNDTPIPAFKVFGKPHPEPYRLMEGLLVEQAKLIGLDLPKSGGKLPFGAVYAVGDNPASDIAGARAAGTLFRCICSHAFLDCLLVCCSAACLHLLTALKSVLGLNA